MDEHNGKLSFLTSLRQSVIGHVVLAVPVWLSRAESEPTAASSAASHKIQLFLNWKNVSVKNNLATWIDIFPVVCRYQLHFQLY